MFALIESSPAPRHGSAWAPRMASFAVHTALIASAVLATQHAITTTAPPIVDVGLVWTSPPAQPDLPAPTSPQTSTTPIPGWSVPAPNLSISPEIPLPGTSEVLPPPGGDPIPGSVIGNPLISAVVPGHAPLEARYVDELPSMIGHPELNYPEVLRQAGIEGRVMVEAVLDTLGRAEPGSLRVTDSPNPLFDREAVAVVLGSRYRPGRVDGHAVRVRIQVPVAFTIRR